MCIEASIYILFNDQTNKMHNSVLLDSLCCYKYLLRYICLALVMCGQRHFAKELKNLQQVEMELKVEMFRS